MVRECRRWTGVRVRTGVYGRSERTVHTVSTERKSLMSRSTGLAMIASGSVLMLAVHIQVPGLNLGLVGLVILVTGLAGLQVPQRTCSWLWRNRDAIKLTLEQIPEQGERNRVPLDALLRRNDIGSGH
jgi:hypothetical protein